MCTQTCWERGPGQNDYCQKQCNCRSQYSHGEGEVGSAHKPIVLERPAALGCRLRLFSVRDGPAMEISARRCRSPNEASPFPLGVA